MTRVRISGAKRADIEKRLGFPEKPKYPAHPFFRFSEELRPTLKPTGDGRKASDIVVELGALWRNTDDEKKAIYRQAYEKDLVISVLFKSASVFCHLIYSMPFISFRLNTRKRWKHIRAKSPTSKQRN